MTPTTTLESLQLRVRVGPPRGCEHHGGSRRGLAGGWTQEGFFPCAHIWAGTGHRTDPSTTQDTVPHIPLPARACHLPLLPPPKTGGAGPAAPPTSHCVPRTLWVVPGAELEALTRSRLRPITCAAMLVAPGVRGPGTTLGEVRRWRLAQPPALARTRSGPALGRTHGLGSVQPCLPAGPADGGSCACPQRLSPSQGLSALQTHFS